MYSKIHRIPLSDVNILEAGAIETLSRYGGNKTIEQFRKESQVLEKRSYTLLPPMRPLNSIIVEDNNHEADPEEKKYVLKRDKPLIKKNSLIKSGFIEKKADQ
jgi:hypothetical protein